MASPSTLEDHEIPPDPKNPVKLLVSMLVETLVVSD